MITVMIAPVAHSHHLNRLAPIPATGINQHPETSSHRADHIQRTRCLHIAQRTCHLEHPKCRLARQAGRRRAERGGERGEIERGGNGESGNRTNFHLPFPVSLFPLLPSFPISPLSAPSRPPFL